MRGTPWTDGEDALIRELYPAHGRQWRGWAELLPARTQAAISDHARSLGVRYEGPLTHQRYDERRAIEDATAAIAALDEWQRARLWYLVRHAGRERG